MSTSSQPSKTPGHGRNIILAFDGTADTFDNDITNIVRLVSLLDKTSPDEQLVYYQPGIGTYLDPSFLGFSPWMRGLAKMLDQGLAWYLDGHIMGGYQYLMENYRPGDKIILFGFSRGAYTARCLAGMLSKVGLLPKSNKEQVQFAYELYHKSSKQDDIRALGFKKAFSIEVEIEFIGVWDTVAAVGTFWSSHRPFTSSNTIIRYFRHALALDERRAKFQANTWHRDPEDGEAKAKDPERGAAINLDGTAETVLQVIKTVSGKTFTVKSTVQSLDGNRGDLVDPFAEEQEPPRETDVREVWFAGCHADVGGGSVSNDTTASLAGPSMRWMLNEILDLTSVKFNEKAVLLQLGIDCRAPRIARRSKFLPTPPGSKFGVTDKRFFSNPKEAKAAAAQVPLIGVPASDPVHGDVVQSPATLDNGTTPPTSATTGSFPISGTSAQTVLTIMEERDYRDATAPAYDMLKIKWMWWILEYIPSYSSHPDENGTWHENFGWNRGHGRRVCESAPLWHSSVKTRMQAGPENLQDGKYHPLATFLGEPTFVD